MKKVFIVIMALVIIFAGVFGVIENKKAENTEYLRIHIRANSNLDADQNVKYAVKEKVVEFLTPVIAQCTSAQLAEELLNNCTSQIEKVANETLLSNGFSYTSKAEIRTEEFPTRTYGNLTLKSGKYRAVIIELGEGVGDNWWCVVYPPLCFVNGNGNYIYKSKIYEIIKNFKEKL